MCPLTKVNLPPCDGGNRSFNDAEVGHVTSRACSFSGELPSWRPSSALQGLLQPPAGIAQIFFFVFLVLFVLSLLGGVLRGGPPSTVCKPAPEFAPATQRAIATVVANRPLRGKKILRVSKPVPRIVAPGRDSMPVTRQSEPTLERTKGGVRSDLSGSILPARWLPFYFSPPQGSPSEESERGYKETYPVRFLERSTL